MTNRDLFHAIEAICKRYDRTNRALEPYLSALLGLARQFSGQDLLLPEQFHALLGDAFTALPLPFDPTWKQISVVLPTGEPRFSDWETTLIRQIVDLHEIEASGLLADTKRQLHITAPSGAEWEVLDALSYIEFGTAGAFCKWDVHGEPILDNGDDFWIALPDDIPARVVELPSLSWAQCINFLERGQTYCRQPTSISSVEQLPCFIPNNIFSDMDSSKLKSIRVVRNKNNSLKCS